MITIPASASRALLCHNASELHDYLVIGAGSAGCTLAARLTETAETHVLLIEAGPPDSQREIHIPAAFSKLFKTPLDWNYVTEPQEHLNGRRLYWPRGKMLGGSSSMNAMVYTRGRRADFDRWRDLGNQGWAFDDVLPFFESSRNHVADLKCVNPLSDAFVRACEQCGIGRNPDFSGPGQEGSGFYQVTQKNGARWSVADEYLRPALRRGNLTVWTGIHVARVLFEGKRATGVEYIQGGSRHQVRCDREVILTAGAIGSPQLLLLSGVGPPEQLETLGIPVVADLPGVGGNLRDHLAVMTPYFCTKPVSLAGAGTFMDVLEYFVKRTGRLTSNIAEAGAFVKSRPDLTECDLQFVFAPVHYVEHGFAKPGGHGFSLGPILLTPKSTGRIALRSADPLDSPAIDPAYLSAPEDLGPLVEGLKLARRIAEADAFEPYRGQPVFEQGDPATYIRARAETIYHPAGTCKMGQDSASVVNAQLEVHGMSGLRVVDASIMPSIIGTTLNATVIMIAEKAAGIIQGHETPP
jgi:choline dehydrogenase